VRMDSAPDSSAAARALASVRPPSCLPPAAIESAIRQRTSDSVRAKQIEAVIIAPERLEVARLEPRAL